MAGPGKTGPAPVDYTGSKFNKFTVVGLYGRVSTGRSWWVCRCECGNEKICRLDALKASVSKDCGCGEFSRRQSAAVEINRKMGRTGGLHKDISVYKANARNRAVEWALTDQEATDLMLGSCHYCGIEPCGGVTTKMLNKVPFRNGIDRVDSTKGYSLDNVVSCCAACNLGKGKMPAEDFLAWANRIAKHQDLKHQSTFDLVAIARGDQDPMKWAVM